MKMPATTFDDLAKPFEGLKLMSVGLLSEQMNLPANSLLHAGPPYDSPDQIPLPVMNAAAQILLLDGLCDSLDAARSMITRSAVRLVAAQDFGVVTPLAQVVSGRSLVFQVTDGHISRFAPLVEGPPPALRFGSDNPRCLAAMRDMDAVALAMQSILSEQPLLLHPVIKAGLLDGDECHAVTQATHRHLVNAMPELERLLGDKPWFVLPILMAASAVALGRQGGLAAVGGNGVQFGWKSANSANHPHSAAWHSTLASVPLGQMFSDESESCVLPAIGDSAVIDFAGLGAQALTCSPDMQVVWQTCLPERTPVERADVIDPGTGLVCPARLSLRHRSPAVHLAMVDALGSGKILGRGVYVPDPDLFSIKHESSQRGLV